MVQVQSSGFLYKQVRNMVGALIHVGRGMARFSICPHTLMEIGNSLHAGGWSVAGARPATAQVLDYDDLDLGDR